MPSREATLDPWLDESTGPLAAAQTCLEDYSPCTCSMSTTEGFLVILCNDVPSFEAVKSVFQRTTTQVIRAFAFTVPLSEINNPVPANLLSGKSAQLIDIRCPNMGTKLTIDPDAFNSSKNYTGYVRIFGCDHSYLDYTFLSDFNNLTELWLSSSRNITQWSSLPALPSLLTFSVIASNDLEDLRNFPFHLLPVLNYFYISYCPNFQHMPIIPTVTMLTIDTCPLFKQWDVVGQMDKLYCFSLIGLNNQSIHEALNAFVSSPLISQLLSLTLHLITDMTHVPPQIKSFSKLQDLLMSYNSITTARRGSFTFSTPQLRLLSFLSNNLSTIEPSAFEGEL